MAAHTRWRVRGVPGPAHCNKEKLAELLLQHPDLQPSSGANHVRVDTLALDVGRAGFQVATVRFGLVPRLLDNLGKSGGSATIPLLKNTHSETFSA